MKKRLRYLHDNFSEIEDYTEPRNDVKIERILTKISWLDAS